MSTLGSRDRTAMNSRFTLVAKWLTTWTTELQRQPEICKKYTFIVLINCLLLQDFLTNCQYRYHLHVFKLVKLQIVHYFLRWQLKTICQSWETTPWVKNMDLNSNPQSPQKIGWIQEDTSIISVILQSYGRWRQETPQKHIVQQG